MHSVRFIEMSSQPSSVTAGPCWEVEVAASSPPSVITPSALVELMAGWTTSFGDEAALVQAASVGDTATVCRLLRAGVDANRLGSIEGVSHPVSALTIASVRGHLRTVEALLHGGAAAHMRVGNGYTALYLACLAGHAAVARLLCLAGAPAEAADMAGTTPLLAACINGHSACVTVLLSGGGGAAAINVARRDGATPLQVARHGNHTAIVDQLLAAGADTFAMS